VIHGPQALAAAFAVLWLLGIGLATAFAVLGIGLATAFAVLGIVV